MTETPGTPASPATAASPDQAEQAQQPVPTKRQIARWQRYLANERAEGAVYRELAWKKTGEERAILLAIADAEARHEEYWRNKLGAYVGLPRQASLGTRMLAFLARRFGSVFVLAMIQSAEQRTDYLDDEDASEQMIADEAVHAEVVRGLAARGRAKMSGDFRAAVFGANDGLVSNLALVLGMVGSGVSSSVVLVTGVAGLLAGALSMAAGEYVSVSSQHELLRANRPALDAHMSIPKLDVQENELALVYRARGMSEADAAAKAQEVFESLSWVAGSVAPAQTAEPIVAVEEEEEGGSALSAAVSSFLCFAVGAAIPVLPYVFGLGGWAAVTVAAVLVGLSLMLTGAIVGMLSGTSPLLRALRQLAIGFAAAGATYGLGSLFQVTLG